MEDNHKTDIYNMDMTIGEETLDAKIMTIEVKVGIEADKILEEMQVMTGMTVEIGTGVEQEREA